uniref:Uncharacterized protein n=1 Tax=Nicotiana tabacum TaxID=4097 RepID=A0A1S4CJ84_TOBAC|nr:PREDICTED: uncharacterized protein LOC107819659 [Nicotiana tabacum]
MGENKASRAPLNCDFQTALHVAVGAKNDNAKHFVEKLVDSMAPDDPLDMGDCNGDTPLHYAARFGNLDAAKILVGRNKNLPNIGSEGDLYPIHDASTMQLNMASILWISMLISWVSLQSLILIQAPAALGFSAD